MPNETRGTIEDYAQNASPRQIANELHFADTLAAASLEYKLAAFLIVDRECMKLMELKGELSQLLFKNGATTQELADARAIVTLLVERRE